MKKYAVTRLDRRYNGHIKFKYFISPISRDLIQGRRDFQALREWAWGCYGPGMELDWACSMSHVDKTEPIYSWCTEHGNRRLYLRGNKELTVFELKF